MKSIFRMQVCVWLSVSLLPTVAHALQAPAVPEPGMLSLVVAGGVVGVIAYLRSRRR